MFISHDDVDHTGNLNALMEPPERDASSSTGSCRSGWAPARRAAEAPALGQRRRAFTVGDRTLYAVRPPVFDSPTTRGLFDPTTGVYWASDSFATPMLISSATSQTSTPASGTTGMAMFNQYVSPWSPLLDDAKFQTTVEPHRGARHHQHRRLPHAPHRAVACRAGAASDPDVRAGDRARRARARGARPDARRHPARRVSGPSQPTANSVARTVRSDGPRDADAGPHGPGHGANFGGRRSTNDTTPSVASVRAARLAHGRQPRRSHRGAAARGRRRSAASSPRAIEARRSRRGRRRRPGRRRGVRRRARVGRRSRCDTPPLP